MKLRPSITAASAPVAMKVARRPQTTNKYSHRQVPAFPIGGPNEGVGGFIVGESHRLIVPFQGLAGEPDGDGAKQGGLGERPRV